MLLGAHVPTSGGLARTPERGHEIGAAAIQVTAGQGTCVGHRVGHLAEILAGLDDPDRVGVCLDTCHLYAAGYDIATLRGYEAMLGELDRRVGVARVRSLHLNDAKRELGSRVDRHAPIGAGHLAWRTFRRLVNDPRLAGVPAVVETPGPLARWRVELRGLRRLRSARRRG